MIQFTRYLQLFSLHQVQADKQAVRHIELRLSILHYTLKALPASLNEAWQEDPYTAITKVQSVIRPRIATLMEDSAIQENMLQTKWEPYQALRQQNAIPQLPPTQALTPSYHQSLFDRRMAQAERLLYLGKMTLDIANAGLILWHTWRAARDQGQLVIDAVRKTIESQEKALASATSEDFVRGYLAAHNEDPVYPIVFPEESED